MNNIAFQIHHINGKNNYRDVLYKNVKNYLSNYCDNLNLETVEIKDKQGLEEFQAQNPDFKVNSEGIELNNVQGWRYGEIGLWASTFLAYKKFSFSQYNFLLLVEDDIEFDNDLIENIKMCLSQAPENWDVIFLFAPGNTSNEINISENNIVESYHDWSTLCYLINKNTVNKVIEDIKDGIYLPIDWYFLRQKNKYKSYTIDKSKKMSCRPADIESSFQHQERQIIK
jgi:GR25 family glycosyltransferase involved in LPS biosynthesis